MKTRIFFLHLFFIAVVFTAAGQSKTEKATIKVFGNCGMCKERIEKALDRNGIKMASWSPETKSLEVVYNSKKVTEQQIHEWVAASGHDTEKVKADDEVYAKLPFCCLYRDHDHSGIQDKKHHD